MTSSKEYEEKLKLNPTSVLYITEKLKVFDCDTSDLLKVCLDLSEEDYPKALNLYANSDVIDICRMMGYFKEKSKPEKGSEI